MKQQFDRLDYGVKVKDLKISKNNEKFIDKFLKYMKGHIVEDRLRKYNYVLRRFAHLVEKDFDKLTKEDIREVAGIIANSKTLTTTTKEDFMSDTKRAFKYLFGDEEDYPSFIKPLRLPKNAKQKGVLRLPTEVLTERETYQMIKACGNARDKFFIALIGLDGGLRPCEAYRMKWKQIKKDKHSHFIVVDTAKKSGDKDTRVIRIIKSEPYFIKWINEYPKTKTDEDFVFINYSNLEPMNDGTTHALFRRLRKKLKWDKRIYPYLFRHSVLTRMSKDPTISISVLKKFAGHTQRSNIIGEYQHFGDDDLKDMQLQYNGLKKADVKKEVEKKPRVCPKCKKSNEYDSEFCGYCNFALTQKRMVESNDELAKEIQELKEFKDLVRQWFLRLKDPDFKISPENLPR